MAKIESHNWNTVKRTGDTMTGALAFNAGGSAINDSNGNELIKVTATASAVNELTIANAATGNAPILSATGGDTNVDIVLSPKGSGAVNLLDNVAIKLGTGLDASILYDGTNMVINPKVVGTGIVSIKGDVSTTGNLTLFDPIAYTFGTSGKIVSQVPASAGPQAGILFENTNQIASNNDTSGSPGIAPFWFANGTNNVIAGVLHDTNIASLGIVGIGFNVVVPTNFTGANDFGMFVADFNAIAPNTGFYAIAEYLTENGLFINFNRTGIGSRHITIGTSDFDNGGGGSLPDYVLISGQRRIMSQNVNVNNPTLELQNNSANTTDILGSASAWNISTTGALSDGMTATTQATLDNSTKIATTAYVDSAIGADNSLQEVYTNGGAGGGAITLTTSGGAIVLTVPDTANIAGLTIAQNDVTNNPYAFSTISTANNYPVRIQSAIQNTLLLEGTISGPVATFKSLTVSTNAGGLIWENSTGNQIFNLLTDWGGDNLANIFLGSEMRTEMFVHQSGDIGIGDIAINGLSPWNIDSAGLFYDQSTNRIGIGTITPASALEVNNLSNVAGSGRTLTSIRTKSGPPSDMAANFFQLNDGAASAIDTVMEVEFNQTVIKTAQISSGVKITMSGNASDSGGDYYGINLANFTSSTSSTIKNAINVGTGWNNDISASNWHVTSEGQIRMRSGNSVSYGYSFAGDTNTLINNPSPDAIRFITGGTARWDIESGGILRADNAGATVAAHVGSVTNPAYAFQNDLDTGIYSPANDQVAITTAGTFALIVNENQRVGIGTASPATLLDVNGTATINSLIIDGVTLNTLIVDTTTLIADAMSHNVGIGTASPAYKLTVQGGAVDFFGGFFHCDGISGLTTLSELTVNNNANISTGNITTGNITTINTTTGNIVTVNATTVGANTVNADEMFISKNQNSATQLHINNTTAGTDAVVGIIMGTDDTGELNLVLTSSAFTGFPNAAALTVNAEGGLYIENTLGDVIIEPLQEADGNGFNVNITASDGFDSGVTARDGGDVVLTPGLAVNGGIDGNVKFGVHSVVGAETVSGFIMIRDSGGTLRKLAVIS